MRKAIVVSSCLLSPSSHMPSSYPPPFLFYHLPSAFTSSSDLPQHICRQIEEEKEGERKELEKQERGRNLCKV